MEDIQHDTPPSVVETQPDGMNQVDQVESTPTESAPIGQDSGDSVTEGSGNEEELLVEMLIGQRSEIRDQIKTSCDEISHTLHMGGSLSQLNAMVAQAEDLLQQSEVLNDQICEFTELVDTAAEFQLQLEYQNEVQDIKEAVQNYSELF